jgi:hypothetical protein
MLKNIFTSFFSAISFYGLVLLAIILGFLLFFFIEISIGLITGCTLEEGAVLVSLYCHEQVGTFYDWLEVGSAFLHGIIFIIGIIIIGLLFNPISFLFIWGVNFVFSLLSPDEVVFGAAIWQKIFLIVPKPSASWFDKRIVFELSGKISRGKKNSL